MAFVFRTARRWPAPDFMAEGAAARPWARWAAVSGVVALVAAAWTVQSRQSDIDRLAVVAVDKDGPITAPRLDRSGAALSQDDDAARRAAVRVAAALDHPWTAVFATLDASTPQSVYWLHFEHTAGSGELRLEGRAADVAASLRLVDALASRPAWHDVALTRWQRSASDDVQARDRPLRFTVEARLDATAIVAAARRAVP